MFDNHSSKDPNTVLSWVEWTIAIGIAGMGLSLVIYSFLAASSSL